MGTALQPWTVPASRPFHPFMEKLNDMAKGKAHKDARAKQMRELQKALQKHSAPLPPPPSTAPPSVSERESVHSVGSRKRRAGENHPSSEAGSEAKRSRLLRRTSEESKFSRMASEEVLSRKSSGDGLHRPSSFDSGGGGALSRGQELLRLGQNARALRSGREAKRRSEEAGASGVTSKTAFAREREEYAQKHDRAVKQVLQTMEEDKVSRVI